jgi:calcineurin-like phosphoesterase family protein
MTVFFSSDHHLWHQNILKFDNRPFATIEEMNEQLILRHNSIVAPDDEWHALGDMLMGLKFKEHTEIFSEFNGNKKLYSGNHDRTSATNKLRERRDYWPYYSKHFTMMPDNFQVKVKDHVFNVSHFPYDGDHMEKDRYEEYRLEDKGVPLIHGHTHSKKKFSYSKNGSLQICVSVTAWDYYPAHENEIIELLEKHG